MKKVKSKNKEKSSKETVKSVPHKEEANSIGEFETEDDDYKYSNIFKGDFLSNKYCTKK